MKKTILITRPKNQAHKISQYLNDQGFKVILEPLFAVHKIDQRNFFRDNLIKKIAQRNLLALIVTSANAAQAVFASCEILHLNKNIKIFVVGKKTAEIFLENGFNNLRWAEQSSAADLQKLIEEDGELMQQKNQGKVLYFCGDNITLDFEQELKNKGVEVEKIISYRVVEVQNFSAEFLVQTQQIKFDFVLIYSQNSARYFFNLCKKHNLLEYFESSQILCLSEKISAVLRDFGFTNLATFDAIPTLKKFYD